VICLRRQQKPWAIDYRRLQMVVGNFQTICTAELNVGARWSFPSGQRAFIGS